MEEKEFEYILSTHEKKQMTQLALETFTLGKENMFENHADSIIKKILDNKNIEFKKYKELLKKEAK
ncbi:hypothetical protein [Flavivirga rizhaonensis]|uniref:Uncharacterized protein n=1 Tax=Flavivirga rizhaonensis TaxID=2559571 RepID=A0A4S1E3S8_9FLAO|nr:hypothetical protein [Flavivirga rizhaonensis]TGV04708.1 hypothetical protein EM932_00860 [Flavivirga rizhaonensis]